MHLNEYLNMYIRIYNILFLKIENLNAFILAQCL